MKCGLDEEVEFWSNYINKSSTQQNTSTFNKAKQMLKNAQLKQSLQKPKCKKRRAIYGIKQAIH